MLCKLLHNIENQRKLFNPFKHANIILISKQIKTIQRNKTTEQQHSLTFQSHFYIFRYLVQQQIASQYQNLPQFSMVTITNYHKCGGWQEQEFIFS